MYTFISIFIFEYNNDGAHAQIAQYLFTIFKCYILLLFIALEGSSATVYIIYIQYLCI